MIITSGIITLVMGFYNTDIIEDAVIVVISHVWIVICFTEFLAKFYFLGWKFVSHGWHRKLDTVLAVLSFMLLIGGKVSMKIHGEETEGREASD